MNVELPDTGCNIINSSTSFYNYSPDRLTRKTYIIYDGSAILQAESYNQYGYSYSGTCLTTGDLVYKPEYKEIIWPLISIVACLFLFFGAYKLILSHWWRKR